MNERARRSWQKATTGLDPRWLSGSSPPTPTTWSGNFDICKIFLRNIFSFFPCFQLRNSNKLRIFPVLDTFSEANNRLTSKRICSSHKPQACSIHVSASKETCVSICSQSRIFKMCFFPTVSQAMRCWGGLCQIMARLHNNTTTKDQPIPGAARV